MMMDAQGFGWMHPVRRWLNADAVMRRANVANAVEQARTTVKNFTPSAVPSPPAAALV